jgi:hypothetical protein
VTRLLEAEMVPHPLESADSGLKVRFNEAMGNLIQLFSGSIRKPMLIMIYVQFAIQFG